MIGNHLIEDRPHPDTGLFEPYTDDGNRLRQISLVGIDNLGVAARVHPTAPAMPTGTIKAAGSLDTTSNEIPALRLPA